MRDAKKWQQIMREKRLWKLTSVVCNCWRCLSIFFLTCTSALKNLNHFWKVSSCRSGRYNWSQLIRQTWNPKTWIILIFVHRRLLFTTRVPATRGWLLDGPGPLNLPNSQMDVARNFGCVTRHCKTSTSGSFSTWLTLESRHKWCTDATTIWLQLCKPDQTRLLLLQPSGCSALCLLCSGWSVHLSDQASSGRPGAGPSCTVWRAQSGGGASSNPPAKPLLDFPSCPPIKPVLLGTHGQQNAAARPLFALSPPAPAPSKMQLAPLKPLLAFPLHFISQSSLKIIDLLLKNVVLKLVESFEHVLEKRCSLNGSFHFDLLPKSCLSCSNSPLFSTFESSFEEKSIWKVHFTKSHFLEIWKRILMAFWLMSPASTSIQHLENLVTTLSMATIWWNDDWRELYEVGNKSCPTNGYISGIEVDLGLWEAPTSGVIQPYPCLSNVSYNLCLSTQFKASTHVFYLLFYMEKPCIQIYHESIILRHYLVDFDTLQRIKMYSLKCTASQNCLPLSMWITG